MKRYLGRRLRRRFWRHHDGDVVLDSAYVEDCYRFQLLGIPVFWWAKHVREVPLWELATVLLGHSVLWPKENG